MKSETERFFKQAHMCVGRADVMLTVNLTTMRGVPPTWHVFTPRKLFIFEKTGKSAKTHNGVRTEFVRLTKDDKRVDPALRRFLFKSYDFKSAADYFTGGDDAISPRLAEDAVATAKRFVAHLIDLI